jgi:hypothetical protein
LSAIAQLAEFGYWNKGNQGITQMFSLTASEALIAKALKVEPDGRGALSASLKYFRKRGFPELPKRGRGVSSGLQERQVFELLVAFRLTKLGFPPTSAIDGAGKASKALGGENDRPPFNPYLIYDGNDVTIESAERLHAMIDRRESATVVSLEPLMAAFMTALPSNTGAAKLPPDDFMDVVDYILEHRDGDR